MSFFSSKYLLNCVFKQFTLNSKLQQRQISTYHARSDAFGKIDPLFPWKRVLLIQSKEKTEKK